MYELIKVTEKCFYIHSPARIGLIRTGDEQVCLIDSGNDRDAGKKILRILDENGWTLEAIYLTHSHADHMGGSDYLRRRTGCRVYAFGAERCFAESPVLEPAFLYGAFPNSDLRHKFLMAQPCEVLPLTKDCLPQGMELIPLPGHSWDMVGFRLDDGTVYLADSLASRETLDKYKVSFLVDVRSYLETLEKIKEMSAGCFIPAHAEPTEEIVPLADYNIEKVHENAELILDICHEPLPFDAILKNVFDRCALTMTFEQHALVGSTVRSYLTYLKEEGRLTAAIKDNMLIWEKS